MQDETSRTIEEAQNMKDVTGRTLTSGDVAEINRMNAENAEAAKRAQESRSSK